MGAGMGRESVAVVGNGYVGTVVAACFASLGRTVVGVESDESKLTMLQQGRAPFYEARLDDLLEEQLATGRLTFTKDLRSALADSQIIFLCVGTPSVADGRADMQALEVAAREIGRALQRHHILVTKSTVPIGSSNWLSGIVESAISETPDNRRSISVVSNPEFLREGNAINDFLHPDRIVLGGDDEAVAAVAELYRPILEQSFNGINSRSRPPLIKTDLVTAETIKYASNTFLATKVSFINEIANICDLVGAEITDVATAMGLDPRIGPQFLSAGAGWGGSCFGKDLDALVAVAEDHEYDAELLKATASVNDRQRGVIIQKLHRGLGTLRGRRIGILGLAFKPGTDDLRDAPSVEVASRLLSMGAFVHAHDPVVDSVPELPNLSIAASAYEVAEDADALVLLTEWPEFLALDLDKLKDRMRGDLFLDARNVFDPAVVSESGLIYEGVGRLGFTA
jgi:UDPglucose 6-dehydrogenase